jgi:hypothetical protein
LPGGFVHVDGKKAKRSAGALGFWRTRTATFSGSDVGIGTVPHAAATIVQLRPKACDAEPNMSKPASTIQYIAPVQLESKAAAYHNVRQSVRATLHTGHATPAVNLRKAA